jgi:hypothetical protein
MARGCWCRGALDARPQNAWALAGAQKVLSAQNLSAAAVLDVTDNADKKAIYRAGLVGDYQLSLTPDEAALAFETSYHPHMCAFIVSLRKQGMPGLFTLANQQLDLAPSARFAARYKPTVKYADTSGVVENVDFGFRPGSPIPRVSPYATYNWEVFFHAPLLVATRLSQNQRFEDAMAWFHYIFNPTLGDGAYWQAAPLAKVPQQNVQDLVQALHDGDPGVQAQLDEWRDHPFQPHLLARMRLAAYQKATVMKYPDFAAGSKIGVMCPPPLCGRRRLMPRVVFGGSRACGNITGYRAFSQSRSALSSFQTACLGTPAEVAQAGSHARKAAALARSVNSA